MPWLEDLKFPRGYQMGTHKKIYNIPSLTVEKEKSARKPLFKV